MKVLYLASRTPEVESLALEVEITSVQRRLITDTAEPAQFIFLPDIKLEEIPIEIAKHKPDVLHISVHGEGEGLWFASGAIGLLSLSGTQLLAFLPRDRLPKLIFLNACKSDKIAEVLSSAPVAVIGTTNVITNRGSISAATLLYDRLLHGNTIAQAYTAVDALVQALEAGRTELVLRVGRPDLIDRPLITLPRLVAKLAEDEPFLEADEVRVQLGFAGCPDSTTQVCFFTDDETFLDDDAPDAEEESLTEVVRGRPRGGEVWTETNWEVDGDCRVAACGITTSGATFSASALLSDLLEGYVASVPAPESYLAALPRVADFLRANNGAGLQGWSPKKSKTKAGGKKRR